MGLGLPDCWVAVARRGIALLELKVVKRGKKVNLSPHQIAFHVTHGAMQIPCFVLVQYHPPKAPTIRGAQWLLYRSDQVMDLVREGVDLSPAASWPADGVRWHMLKDALMTY